MRTITSLLNILISLLFVSSVYAVSVGSEANVNNLSILECYADVDCDDNNPYTLDECVNPGTFASFCSHTQINCIQDSDCGATGFFGQPFCSEDNEDNVLNNFITSTCINSGTTSSYCRIDVQPVIIEDCANACVEGQCQTPIQGDFNQDGIANAQDIDLLCQAVKTINEEQIFDLNGDSKINKGDVNYLVKTILGTKFGDANLDKKIDANDLAIVRSNFWAQNSSSWNQGNFNCNNYVDIYDLMLVRRNFGFSA